MEAPPCCCGSGTLLPDGVRRRGAGFLRSSSTATLWPPAEAVRFVTCLALCLFCLPLAAAEQQEPAEAQRVAFAGEPLSTLLPRVCAGLGLQLSAAPSLANQRISLYGHRIDRELVMDGLKQLLSAPPDGQVFWSGTLMRRELRLEESRRRREIAHEMREAAVDDYFAWLDEKMRWAVREGPGILDRAAGSARGHSAARALEAVGPFALLAGLGKENMARLRLGEPVWVRFDQLTGSDAARLGRTWLEMRSGQRDTDTGRPKNPVVEGADEWAGGTEDWVQIIMLEEVAGDPRRLQLGSILVRDPRGSRRRGRLSPALNRVFYSQDAYMAPLSSIDRMGYIASFGFDRPLPDEREDEPRVSFQLIPPSRDPFPVKVTMDELLDRLSQASGITILADGYLRPYVRLPAGTAIKDVPVRRVLARIAEYWVCNWSWLDAKEKTALIRSRAWAFEDEADVPPATVARLVSKLDGTRIPDLDDLAELAELSQRQIRKLTTETGLCRAGTHLLFEVMNVPNAPGRNMLRFYKALPPAMQKRMRTEAGAGLAGLSPDLVRAYLLPALLTGAGLALPEWINRLSRIRLVERRVEGKDGAAAWNYTFHVDTGEERGIRCSVDIRGIVPAKSKKLELPAFRSQGGSGGLPSGVTILPPRPPE